MNPSQPTSNDRRVLHIAAAALISTCGLAASIATASPDTTAAVSASEATASPAAEVLDRAQALITEGKSYSARAMLEELTGGSNGLSLTGPESARAADLLSQARRALLSADPISVSLQKARYQFGKDRLADAERQASAVLLTENASATQKREAEAVLTLVEARRDALAPFAAEHIAMAEQAFNAGAYAAAKAELEAVQNAGFSLSSEQSRTVRSLLDSVQEIEITTGRVFQVSEPVTLGVFEPGVAERRAWGRVEEASFETASTAASTNESAQPSQSGQSTDVVEQVMSANAQALLAEADEAYANGRWAEAADAYQRVLQVEFRRFLRDDQATRAQENLGDARVELAGGVQGVDLGGSPLDEANQTDQVIVEQARASFNNAVSQSAAALASGDVDEARRAASRAQLILRDNERRLPAGEAEEKRTQIDELFRTINERAERLRIEQQEDLVRDLAESEATARAEFEEQKQREIDELVERVRALQLEQEYEKALQEVDRILFLDPNNAVGQILRDIIRDTMIVTGYEEVQREKRVRDALSTYENYKASVPPLGIVDYPDDWVEISTRRGDPLKFSESAVNRAVLDTLESRRIPVNFDENAFADVLTFIRNVGGLEMDIDWESLQDIGVDRDSPVSLNLTSVTLESVLNRVLSKVSEPDLPAGWAVYDGILTVASDEVLRRNTILEIYDIRDLLHQIPQFDQAPEFDLNAIFQAGGGQGGGGGQSPFQNQQQDEIRRTPLEIIEQIQELIRTNVDFEGWELNGGDTGTIQEWNGNLIITNTPKNHRAIYGLLSKLRAVRSIQINAESRFLAVTEEYFEQIGFDIDLYFNVEGEAVDFVRRQSPTLTGADFFNTDGTLTNTINGVDIPSPRAPQSVPGSTEIIPGVPLNSPVGGPTVPLVSNADRNPDQFSPIGGRQNSLGILDAIGTTTGIAGDLAGVGPALSVAGRFLDDIQVDFLIQATQADTRSTSLTAPRLTFTNGQQAFLFVAQQQSFVSDLQPVVANGATAFDPEIDVVASGVALTLDAVVSADRRYVTMNVNTQLGDVTFDTEREFSAGGAGAGGGGAVAATAEASIQIPVVTITSVRTTVTVPDQGTMLLGGQRLVNESEAEAGVPILSKIPILNRFFSNRRESRTERTLLILIKPTILIQSEEEEKAFPGLLDQLGS